MITRKEMKMLLDPVLLFLKVLTKQRGNGCSIKDRFLNVDESDKYIARGLLSGMIILLKSLFIF